MNCIFCKKNSSSSQSVEHIIPESLGGWEYTLPCGVVCDNCNNYLSREVEKPLLDTPYFRDMRCRTRIQTKRGHPPSVVGVDLEGRTPVSLYPDMEGYGASIAATYPEDEIGWIRSIMKRSHWTLIVPVPTKPEERFMSRFLGKVAIEALALRLLEVPLGLQEVIEKRELDPLRDHVRRGGPIKHWQYNERHLYQSEFLFYEAGYGSYEILNEWTFLYTDHQELYLVVALFGVEYAINLGEPDVEGYRNWLSKNSGHSPLYPQGLDIPEPDASPNAAIPRR